jgi:hypothetical protein
LGNTELLDVIFSDAHIYWTCESILPRLMLLHEEACEYQRELDFIASHFCDLTKAQLSEVGPGLLSEVLSSRQLRVKSETWLFNLLSDRLRQSPEGFSLLEFVRLEYLSTSAMTKVVDVIQSQFDALTFPIWLALVPRLTLPVAPIQEDDRLFWRDCELDPSKPLEGIISYLTNVYGGNVAEKRVVDITASGYWKDHYPHCAADLLGNSYFESDTAPNQWICYDFRVMRIRPTHYSLRSQYNGALNGFHPKSWVVEASVDGQGWTEIDRRLDTDAINGKNVTATFACSTLRETRMVRLRQIGKNWTGNNTLLFSSLEIFGALREDDEARN